MMRERLRNIVKTDNGVIYLGNSEGLKSFEEDYLRAREKEGRLLNDELVKMLPNLPNSHPLRNEWLQREATQKRLCKYLSAKQRHLSILDIGCGNGWFSHKLKSVLSQAEIFALDVNLQELQQAVSLFSKDETFFLYGDVFQDIFIPESFDVIILNSSVQYFDDIKKLVNRLLDLLSKEGEIHIVDSPFYDNQELKKEAGIRSYNYFSKIGVNNMIQYYHHHAHACFKDYSSKILYDPKSFINTLLKIFGIRINPFPWIRITHS